MDKNSERSGDKNVHEPIPYIPFQDFIATTERNAKRLYVSLIIAIALLFVSNAIWLYAWFSYDYVSEETVTVDGKEGIASYVGGDGSIYNGESDYSAREVQKEKIEQ